MPRHVKSLCDAPEDHVGHYIFISGISAPRTSETVLMGLSSRDVKIQRQEGRGRTYGGLKAACEISCANYTARYTVIRPTYVVGPGDPGSLHVLAGARFPGR